MRCYSDTSTESIEVARLRASVSSAPGPSDFVCLEKNGPADLTITGPAHSEGYVRPGICLDCQTFEFDLSSSLLRNARLFMLPIWRCQNGVSEPEAEEDGQSSCEGQPCRLLP